MDEFEDEVIELDELKVEWDEYKDCWMCVLVDVENFCKWVDKVCCDVENYGGFKLVCDMLLVYDNMKCVIELIIDE